MLNKLDKNKCLSALELAVYGMEDAIVGKILRS